MTRNVDLKMFIGFVGMFILFGGSFYYGRKVSNDKIARLMIEVHQLEILLGNPSTSLLKQNLHASLVDHRHHILKRSARNPQDHQRQRPSETNRIEIPGITYTRWGRRNCPIVEGTAQVYEGVAAGAYYTHSGGGSNVLCLHKNVIYTAGNYVDGNQGASYIYGLEYRDAGWADHLFNLTLINQHSFRYHDVPCSVCMGRGRVNQMMIPGRESCPESWKKEYTGYILSSAHGNKHASPYLCIDDTPQVVPGSNGNQGGGLLYIVETQCPSLQCDPYTPGREIRCVVCTI